MRRIVAGASILMLTGCGAAAIPVEPPEISDPTVRSVCAAISEDLPTWLGDQARREVEPVAGSDENGDTGAGGRRADQESGEDDPGRATFTEIASAWGDPAVILRCGVPEPRAFERSSACTTIEGVDWFAEEAERGYVFTTIGREARIEVSIPDDYRPESDLLIELASAIDQNNPVQQPCV